MDIKAQIKNKIKKPYCLNSDLIFDKLNSFLTKIIVINNEPNKIVNGIGYLVPNKEKNKSLNIPEKRNKIK